MNIKKTLLAAALGIASLPSTVSASTKNWHCFSGYWHTSSCWDLPGVPVSTDDVSFGPKFGSNTSLTFDAATGTQQVNQLTIDGSLFTTVDFNQLGGNLSTDHETIGISGKANFNQSGGTNTVTDFAYIGYIGNSSGTYNQSGGTSIFKDLLFGYSLGSWGTYNLSGTGELNAFRERLGYNYGIGIFNQSGGTNNVTHLSLSHNSTYNLSGTGYLMATNEYLGGYKGPGNFNQSGGTNNVTNLSLGSNIWSDGTYNQSGGTNNVTNLSLGTASYSNGTYNLSGGVLNVSNNINNTDGTSRLNIDGGTLYLINSATSIDVDNFNVGNAAGSDGSFTLVGGQSLTATNMNIAASGKGTFYQYAGVNSVSNTLTLGLNPGSIGAYNLIGGTLSVNGDLRKGAGYGIFTLDGGTLNVGGAIELDYFRMSTAETSNSSFILANGKSFTSYNETIGISGAGTFTQSGGTHTVSSELGIGAGAGSTGIYNLQGGSLNAYVERIGAGTSGTGTFIQTGGTHTVSSSLTLGANPFVVTCFPNPFFPCPPSSGSSVGTGTYNLQGGSLNAANITVKNSGAFNFTGGTLAVNQFIGNLVNNGGTLAPGNSPGATSITGNYTQSALGIYSVEIGGLLAGQYDVLNVSGIASLDGLLNVSLYDLGGGLFTPHAGDFFDILTADTLYGGFSNFSFAQLYDPSLFWRVDYLYDFNGATDVVRLSIGQNTAPVPEPETYAMLLAGLGLLGFTARRRKKGFNQIDDHGRKGMNPFASS